MKDIELVIKISEDSYKATCIGSMLPLDVENVVNAIKNSTPLEQESILDKIRVEIENDWQLKKYPSSPFSCGLRRAIEIIDKYKAETENK